MAVTVSFYTFSKKINSTAQPSGSGTDIDCVLKEDSSLVSPVFQLLYSGMPSFNYAHVYGRYYYVTDWTYIKHALWECRLVTDILATYKTQIGAASLYVLRASAEYDGTLIDTVYPARSDSSFAAVAVSSPFLSNVQSGSFVVGVAAGDAPTYGATTYYVMDGPAVLYLCQQLASDFVSAANGFSLNDATFELQKALINPFAYLTCCIWFPIAFGDMPYVGTAQPINILGIDTGATGYYLNASSPLKTVSLSWTIPAHPQAAGRGMYMNAAYRKLFLEIPPFGSLELDGSICANYSHVTAEITLDGTTGKGCIRIGCGNSIGTITTLLEKYEGQLGVALQLSSVYQDVIGGAVRAGSSFVNTIANAVAGNYGSALLSAGSGIGNAVETIRPHLQTIGGQGSFASFAGSAILYAQYIMLPDEDLTHVGRPLCKNRTPAAIPGFIQVLDGDIEIPGYAEEAAYIKQQLEGGFFYE
jgi:hypothetical protein